MPTRDQLSAQYNDIKVVLDSALAHGGGVYEAPTGGAAVQFRHKCYAFRKAFREAGVSASPYDRLIIRKLPKGATKVVIEPNTLPGTFTPAQGAPISEPVEIAEDDPLMEEARALRASIGGLDLD